MTNAHEAAPPPVAGDPTTFPAHAELVRTLLDTGGFASLTTLTEAGYPYGSLVAYSTLDDGSLLTCISELAEHTRNARRDPRAGVFVAAARNPDDAHDPLDEPRASIIGELRPYEPTETERARHLSVHPQAAGYAEFDDFGWWRLALVAARFVGGFGAMSWVEAADIAGAEPDPVLPAARQAIEHMNDDHAAANLDIARHLAGLGTARSATVHAIDRHGITLYVDTPEGFRIARLAYPHGALDSPDDIRPAVVEMTRLARERSGVR